MKSMREHVENISEHNLLPSKFYSKNIIDRPLSRMLWNMYTVVVSTQCLNIEIPLN